MSSNSFKSEINLINQFIKRRHGKRRFKWNGASLSVIDENDLESNVYSRTELEKLIPHFPKKINEDADTLRGKQTALLDIWFRNTYQDYVYTYTWDGKQMEIFDGGGRTITTYPLDFITSKIPDFPVNESGEREREEEWSMSKPVSPDGQGILNGTYPLGKKNEARLPLFSSSLRKILEGIEENDAKLISDGISNLLKVDHGITNEESLQEFNEWLSSQLILGNILGNVSMPEDVLPVIESHADAMGMDKDVLMDIIKTHVLTNDKLTSKIKY